MIELHYNYSYTDMNMFRCWTESKLSKSEFKSNVVNMVLYLYSSKLHQYLSIHRKKEKKKRERANQTWNISLITWFQRDVCIKMQTFFLHWLDLKPIDTQEHT